jgi:hypothetical protein
MVALVAAGCGGGEKGGAGSGQLTALSSVAPVEEAFNADTGHARLVLLLSPT